MFAVYSTGKVKWLNRLLIGTISECFRKELDVHVFPFEVEFRRDN